MSLSTAIMIIAVVAIVAETIKSLAKNKKHAIAPQENKQVEQELAQLKERISTLEAIVTDKNYDLGKEIDRL